MNLCFFLIINTFCLKMSQQMLYFMFIMNNYNLIFILALLFFILYLHRNCFCYIFCDYFYFYFYIYIRIYFYFYGANLIVLNMIIVWKMQIQKNILTYFIKLYLSYFIFFY